ncbi:hypothetical protein V6Z11_A12G279800 [Gossypium hirsutum]
MNPGTFYANIFFLLSLPMASQVRDFAPITLEDAASLDGPSATLLLSGSRGL